MNMWIRRAQPLYVRVSRDLHNDTQKKRRENDVERNGAHAKT